MSEGLLLAQRCLQRPMPAGDVASLRVLAGRTAGLADELHRTSATLADCARAGGWQGRAQQEFSRSVLSQLPQLDRAADRYQQYAKALIGYAVTLDRVQPRLVWLRQQLTSSGQVCGASAMPADDDAGRLRSLAAEFDNLWSEWDQSLRRCRHGLSQAGSIEADRHGWSAFGHGFAHALGSVADPLVQFVEHPGLATLSRELGSLADDLTFLGLALLVVFPPAAGVCFSIAAVMSVAKLSTDAVRAARGDPGVGLRTVGADALGAMPGGRTLRAGEDAARASKAIGELAEHDRATRLVPGGGLGAHEAVNGNPEMGHTLLKHVGLSNRKLRLRLQTDPDINCSSAFYDRATAENSISQVMTAHQAEVDAWLRGSKKGLSLTSKLEKPIGVSIFQGGKPLHVSGVRVILRRNYPTSTGYRVHTAFPRP